MTIEIKRDLQYMYGPNTSSPVPIGTCVPELYINGVKVSIDEAKALKENIDHYLQLRGVKTD